MLVKCDKCGIQTEVDLNVRKERELEITFFTCNHCGCEWITLVTDPALRKNISRVARMQEIASSRNTPITFRQKAQNLMSNNMQRGQTLKDEYIKTHNSQGDKSQSS